MMDFGDDDGDMYMQMMIDAEQEMMMDDVDINVLADMEAEWESGQNSSTSQQQPTRVRRLEFDNNNESAPKRPRLENDAFDSNDDNDDDDVVNEPIEEPEVVSMWEVEDYVLRRAPAGNCMTVTGENGRRMYLRMSSACRESSVVEREGRAVHQRKERRNDISLLNIPVRGMLREIDAEALVVKENDESQSNRQSDEKCEARNNKRDNLWVVKYAPKTYFELLSSEKVNREVLAWLKSWSGVVFGDRTNKHNVNDFFESPPRRHRGNNSNNNNKDTNYSSNNRKRQPVLLLAGPPGLGKTTLAHVVARHLGYQPLEINASDDRSAKVLIKKVRNAVEMQAMFSECRPNCVILDEIDGAMGGSGSDDSGAIGALVKLIVGGGKGKNGKTLKPLNRPIICTCNNAYVRALRPLRRIAVVHQFTSIDKSKLVARLSSICHKERVTTERSVLVNLAEICNFDVRSCLNAVQFLATTTDHCIGSKDLEGVPISAKDERQDQFSVWRTIFQRTSGTSRVTMATRKRQQVRGNHAFHDSAARVLHTVESNGEYERLFDGIAANFPNVQYGDPTFSKTVECTEWLSMSDIVTHDVNSNQHQMMRGYLPYCALGVHNVVATQRAFRPQMPRTSFYVRQLHELSNGIIDNLLCRGSQFARNGVSRKAIVLDVVSPLMDILSPSVRAVNFQLLNHTEKKAVMSLVDTMIGNKLTYKRFQHAQGKFSPQSTTDEWQLDPPVNKLTRFDHLAHRVDADVPHWKRNSTQPVSVWQEDRRQLSPVLKELLCREIQHETMRRWSVVDYEEGNSGIQQNGQSIGAMSPPRRRNPQDGVRAVGTPPRTLTNMIKQQYHTPSPRANKKKGKGKKKKSVGLKQSPASRRKKTFLAEHESKLAYARSQKRRSFPIRFKFNEGFTNAVRRPIVVTDFIRNTTHTNTTITTVT